jgi:hypothetical protein
MEVDPRTNKRTIVIAYESDADALPHEHEEAHRALVKKLFEGGMAKDGDAILVERDTERQGPTRATEENQGPEGVKQGS